ncbi:hypothetical protein MesoLj131b_00880 [Mesorhizobium sp. 131-2-5]|nr:hypothetical protein MesoLj131b_00880 [Mesorhizobium sp. 131-2-5]
MQRTVARLVKHCAWRIAVAADDHISKCEIGVDEPCSWIEFDCFEKMVPCRFVDTLSIAAEQFLPTKEVEISIDVGGWRSHRSPTHDSIFYVGDQCGGDPLRHQRLERKDFTLGEAEALPRGAPARRRLGQLYAGGIVGASALDVALGDIIA